MKTLFTLLILSFGNMAFAGQTIAVEVHGLVCDFCARGLEKTMDKVEHIEAFSIDLDSSIMTLQLKKGIMLDDDAITRLVEDAGYSAGKIER